MEVDEARRDDDARGRRSRRPRRRRARSPPRGPRRDTTISPGPSRPARRDRRARPARSRDRRRPRRSPGRRDPGRQRAHAANPGQQVQQGHPDRDPVRGPAPRSATAAPAATSGAISTPSFIGPGCMTSASGRAQRQPLAREPVPRRVLAERRQQPRRHPLLLDPQRHDDVGVPQRVVDRRTSRGTGRPAADARERPRLEAAQERRRAAQPDVGAGGGQRPDVRCARPASGGRRRGSRPSGRRATPPGPTRRERDAACTGRAAPGSGGRASRRRR